MKGKCLCGSVSIIAQDNTQMIACHCAMCRRWGGGPMLTVHGGTDVEIAGVETITAFKSSDWAERAFCTKCGTHLYYRLIPANEYILSVGLFQDGTEFGTEYGLELFVVKVNNRFERIAVFESRPRCPPPATALR